MTEQEVMVLTVKTFAACCIVVGVCGLMHVGVPLIADILAWRQRRKEQDR